MSEPSQGPNVPSSASANSSSADSTPAADSATAAPGASGGAATNAKPRPAHTAVHQVQFIAYPKLLFVWPLILAGFVFWPLGYAPQATSQPTTTSAPAQAETRAEAGADQAMRNATSPADAAGGTSGVSAEQAAPPAGHTAKSAVTQPARGRPRRGHWDRLELLGWAYLWIAVLVLLTLGVDIDRNKAAFLAVVFGLLYVSGLWLHDVQGFTLFGDVFRWFCRLNVQYDRSFGLCLSLILLVPYVLMLGWARLNDRWRITHNEFEHYTFGRMNDSLGRGAKTIRTEFPDVLELLLGMAGTLIVFNATGTRELRRIPHVMFLPFVRRRLDQILERTAITTSQVEDEEDEEEHV